jgi:hypothetical protein
MKKPKEPKIKITNSWVCMREKPKEPFATRLGTKTIKVKIIR